MEDIREELRAKGAKVSGEKIGLLKRGWAMMGFRGYKPHYYVEVEIDDLAMISKHGRHRVYESLCGVEGECSDAAPAFLPGDFEKCKNCSKLEQKKMPVRLWRNSVH